MPDATLVEEHVSCILRGSNTRQFVDIMVGLPAFEMGTGGITIQTADLANVGILVRTDANSHCPLKMFTSVRKHHFTVREMIEWMF